MFTLRIADHSFCIDNRYGYIEKMCTDYIIPDCNAQIISVTDDEIKREENTDIKYSDDYLESLAVYRKICEVLTDDNIILFHCSAIMIDDMAVLFTAPSGTGKSTHAQLWKAHFGNRLKIINDDKPIIRQSKNSFVAYGTPWNGKERRGENICGKIHGIFIIEQFKTNSVEKVKPASELGTLLNQTIRPKNAKLLDNLLAMLESLTKQVPIFRLKCNISDDAVVTACSVIE